MKRAIEILVQLSLVLLAVFGAERLAVPVVIIPRMLHTKLALFSREQLVQVAAVFTAAHALAFLLTWALHRRTTATATPRRFLVEMYFTLAATSLASAGLFLLSSVPFSVNFYAWIYVLVVGLMLAMFVVGAGWRRLRGGRREPGTLRGEVRDAWRLVPTAWTVLTLLVVALPGILAVLYKKSPDFANLVNNTRMAIRDAGGGAKWALADQWAGKTFEQPMWVEFERGDARRFYLLSRPGRVYRYATAPEWREEMLLDLSKQVNTVDSEMGALAMALHPEFGKAGSASGGFVYVWHNQWTPKETRNVLSRFDLSAPTPEARLATRTVLIDQKRPPTGQHNGGTLMFGPDGYLYVSVGDYMTNQAQALNERLSGAVLRIDVDQRGGDRSAPIRRQPKDGVTANYFVPKDNPWYGRPDTLEEFWAIGFRNPFRAWVDPATGEVWLGDVGWERWEELYRVTKGDNGQWPFMEGPEPYRSRPPEVHGQEVQPVYVYRQTSMDRAVVGGVVYRGRRHPPLVGMYVYGDNNSSTVRAIDPVTRGEPLFLGRAGQLGQQGLTAVVTDPAGELLFVTLGSKDRPNGRILRLTSGDEATAVAAAATQESKPLDQVVAEKYEMVCTRCHGSDGKGAAGMIVGEMLTARPDFTDPKWHATAPDDRLRTAILKGSRAVGRSNDMPAWEGFISEEEADAMVKKVRTFAPAK